MRYSEMLLSGFLRVSVVSLYIQAMFYIKASLYFLIHWLSNNRGFETRTLTNGGQEIEGVAPLEVAVESVQQ